ncbi:IclR family transcriptional regulator [Pseudonocardia humida]|uniref:IclR family transcriptional regulator n=1 Tax=Pseudonocardia humida TaxID=2800819 RepID=A0ABT0ZZC5_9PSEU|nr:IclR family transcriptional regulator [Pseudonocardia humida]MCO1656092.1 IclR family transcriptional regulator [Pseudonocardia humida]
MARVATGESVLSRAVRILAVFGPEERALRVSDIAARTGLHVATASRLVAEMVSHGLLTREDDRRVRVGVRLWELAMRASPTLSLREAAMPFLEDLHAVVGHHAQIGVLDGADVLFVERLSAPGAVVNYTRIAGRLPLHASSSGLVLLAHASHELQEQVLAGPLVRYTAATIDTPARLRRTLADIRRDGYAHCPGFIHDEALGVAVPVTDGTRAVVAAVAVIVPNDPADPGAGRAVVPALRAAARGISRILSR